MQIVESVSGKPNATRIISFVHPAQHLYFQGSSIEIAKIVATSIEPSFGARWANAVHVNSDRLSEDSLRRSKIWENCLPSLAVLTRRGCLPVAIAWIPSAWTLPSMNRPSSAACHSPQTFEVCHLLLKRIVRP